MINHNVRQIISKKDPILDINFQAIDWNSYHEKDGDDEHAYTIQIFGRTADDKDVCIKVKGFTPYFFIEIPDRWDMRKIDLLVDTLKKKVSWRTKNNPRHNYDVSQELIRYNVVKRYKFYGFTNKKLFRFVRLVFKSHTAMKEFSYVLMKELQIDAISRKPVLYKRYESNIEPHIRFLHINKLSPCGWINILGKDLIENKEYSNCDLSYEVFWKNVKPSDIDYGIAPLKIMGYDLECISCDHNFPQAMRKTDKITQIGFTMYRYGDMQSYDEHIITLKDCAPIKNATVECYKTEKGLLRGFAKKISELKPDFKAGYNNFGFDDKYIFDRINRIDEEKATKLGISVNDLEDKFSTEILTIMGKVNNKYIMENEGIDKPLTSFVEKNLSSSALGDNILKFFQVPGIISIDVMKVIQRDHKLTGYRLDNVSANFITEETKEIIKNKKTIDNKINIDIYTNNTKALDIGSYIQIMIDDGYSSTPLREGAKYFVKDIISMDETKDGEIVKSQCIKTEINIDDIHELDEILENPLLKIYWTFAKDDMHHSFINKYFKEGDPKKIRQVAKYCLKDCRLVNLLLEKLDIIINSIGMAKVCIVPLSYLFLRGQGVKIFSLVSNECRMENYLIPVLTINKDLIDDHDEKFEGATVITPIPGVYLSPIGVLDYNSLYPQSIRERNMSQETYVDDVAYDNLPGYKYYDIHITKKNKKGKIIRNNDGSPVQVHHRFAEEIVKEGDRKYGILPQILTKLLNARGSTNAKLKIEKDPSTASALNSLQLAYKVVANSLYGQTGAPTSPIFCLAIATSTTAVGRERLYYAKAMVEDNFPGAKIIYGDTDSIFINFNLKNEDGTDRTDTSALEDTIRLSQEAAALINANVPNPQRIVYEKTMHPFILIAKKKYVGLLYEKDVTKCYLKAMGIVLKRRDNSPIVKIIVGGIIDSIIKTRNIVEAINYTKMIITKFMNGEYPIHKFILSKNLKAKYKKPKTIAHRVLADRMTLRDPGNAPQINDRLQYVFVYKDQGHKKKKELQGNIIENPEYVIENKLQIDYLYYLEHQIIIPATQIIELMMPTKQVNKFFNTFITEEWNKRRKRQSMEKWFDTSNTIQDDWIPVLA